MWNPYPCYFCWFILVTSNHTSPSFETLVVFWSAWSLLGSEFCWYLVWTSQLTKICIFHNSQKKLFDSSSAYDWTRMLALLQVLDLSQCQNITDVGVSAILKSVPNLLELDLTYCCPVSSQPSSRIILSPGHNLSPHSSTCYLPARILERGSGGDVLLKERLMSCSQQCQVIILSFPNRN